MKKLTTNLGLKKKINYKTLLGDATLDKNYSSKNNIVAMPHNYFGQFYNACNDPCDMLQGPCSCGATHHQEEWPDDIQLAVFGFVSDKETICKRKPFI